MKFNRTAAHDILSNGLITHNLIGIVLFYAFYFKEFTKKKENPISLFQHESTLVLIIIIASDHIENWFDDKSTIQPPNSSTNTQINIIKMIGFDCIIHNINNFSLQPITLYDLKLPTVFYDQICQVKIYILTNITKIILELPSRQCLIF